MSFEGYEESRALGEPLNLYLFEYGPSQSHRMGLTDGEQTFAFEGVQYRPEPVQRGNINASGTLDRAALEIKCDRECEVAELFRIYPPSQPVRLTVYQGHQDDPARQFLVCWTGRVLNVRWENSEAILMCEPISTSMLRPGLRRRYQIACPHILYGPMCRANKAAATSAATVNTAADGVRQLKVNYTLNATDLRTMRGGTVEWTTPDGLLEARTVLAVQAVGSVATFVLSGIVKAMPQGYPVNLVRGCGHNLDDCGSLHNNLPRYGGMPWIPTKNPVGNYSPYY